MVFKALLSAEEADFKFSGSEYHKSGATTSVSFYHTANIEVEHWGGEGGKNPGSWY